MKLSAAARRFDEIEFFDAYDEETFAFKGQLGLYDDNKRDSETSARRIISTRASVEIPFRRVVKFGSLRFIIGHANHDLFKNSFIRTGWIAHEAAELVTVKTLEEVCFDQPGFTAWSGRAWVKNLAFTEQDSRLPQMYHLNFASNEPVRENMVVKFGQQLYIVRSTNFGTGGNLITACDQLREPAIEEGALVSNDWNALTDSLGGVPTTVRVLRIRWQSLFNYLSPSSPNFGPGDIQVALADADVKPGAKLTLSDGEWFLASVDKIDGAQVCRAVRHERA